MTTAVVFKDSYALQVVLCTGILPPEVQALPASVVNTTDGQLAVVPAKPLHKDVIATLAKFGISTADIAVSGRGVRCWAEAIKLQPTPKTEVPPYVIFSCSLNNITDFAFDLLRLGCDRAEFCIHGDLAYLRVTDPPTYVAVKAMDHENGVRMYAPDPPQQERTWTEFGSKHPLANRLKVDSDALLLIDADRWTSISKSQWNDVNQLVELYAEKAEPLQARTTHETNRNIELRLGNGNHIQPTLWVLHNNAIVEVDRLLSNLSPVDVAQFSFAATTGDNPVVIIKARSGYNPNQKIERHALNVQDGTLGEALEGFGEGYASILGLPDVYVPVGSMVEPPVSTKTLCKALEIDKDDISWLSRVGDTDSIKVEHIASSAFKPLSDWHDYVINHGVAQIMEWQDKTVIDLGNFYSMRLTVPELVKAAPIVDDEKPVRSKVRQAKEEDETYRPMPVSIPKEKTKAVKVAVKAPAELDINIDQDLARLEEEFVAMDTPGDDPTRLESLDKLWRAYLRAKRPRDAWLCFVRILWESDPADIPGLIDEWLKHESFKVKDILKKDNPTGEEVRQVAVMVINNHKAIAENFHAVQRWMDKNDNCLDSRTLWLTRLAFDKLAGGDDLGMAHTVDRVLSRLIGGLVIEQEAPSFLLAPSRSFGVNNDTLTTAINNIYNEVQKCKRKKSPVEAPANITNAYIDLIFAYGMARISASESAKTMTTAAVAALSNKDPVNKFLATSFSTRIERCITGIAPDPTKEAEELAALDRVARYKVDRLREASRILEPTAQIDAIGGFSKKQSDLFGPEFAAIRVANADTRVKEINKLINAAQKETDDKERLVGGILDVLTLVSHNNISVMLANICPVIAKCKETHRAMLYAQALMVAGHFGQVEWILKTLEMLNTEIKSVNSRDLARVLQSCLRTLRRVGLRDEIVKLLSNIGATDKLDMCSKLTVAGGLAYLGEFEQAKTIFADAHKLLGTNMTLTARLDVTRALSSAYGQSPLSVAIDGISRLTEYFKDITDSFGTNSHYCLSVLHFVESLVTGITSDELTINEASRRFIDDDEHLIRRRLHQKRN